MAPQVLFKIGLLTLSFFFFAGNFTVTSIPTEEFDSMLSSIRARGYNLFSNAITTSDLQLDLLTAAANASFTFFAPTDSTLFALAMTQSASAYTATLRYHGLPRRLSLSDLTRLPPHVPIPTLLRSQYVSFTRRHHGSLSDAISVNGVGVVLPGLYYGTHVAVHGLGGILTLHSHNEFLYDSPPPLPPLNPSDPRSFPPQIDRDSKESEDFAVPPPDRSIGHPSVSPSTNPSNSLNETVNFPSNREFLRTAPERSHFQVQAPAISSVPPSASPEFPPADPSMQNENSAPPTPIIDLEEGGETAWMMKSEGEMSGRTVKEYEPSDWMSFGFSEGNSDRVVVEDSHPDPNVPLPQRI